MQYVSQRMPGDDSQPVTTLVALRQLQHALAAQVRPVRQQADVPLAGAVGRVLAAAPAGDAADHAGAGSRIEPRHLARFVAAGQSTARVFARPRIGIVALHDGGSPGPGASAMTAAMLAGAVESLGAQSFRAACRRRCETEFMRLVRMLARECDAVVVAGLLGSHLKPALQRTMVEHGQGTAIRTVHVRRIGTLQFGALGAPLALALSAEPWRAAATFTMLVAPMIRRLQGRRTWAPPPRWARLAEGAAAGAGQAAPLLVREEAGDTQAQRIVRPCLAGDPVQALAAADGIAWRPQDMPQPAGGTVAYFPFRCGFA